MSLLLLARLLSPTLLAAEPNPTRGDTPAVHEAVDPAAGVLIDAVSPLEEVSSARVVSTGRASPEVEVRELHAGRVRDDAVRVRDPAVLTELVPGDEVLIYRDAHGAVLVKAG